MTVYNKPTQIQADAVRHLVNMQSRIKAAGTHRDIDAFVSEAIEMIQYVPSGAKTLADGTIINFDDARDSQIVALRAEIGSHPSLSNYRETIIITIDLLMQSIVLGREAMEGVLKL